MAYDKTVTKFNVQPSEDAEGNLTGIRIQCTVATTRMSDDGKELRRGWPEDYGPEMFVPASHVADLARELVDWPLYFATGQAARDRRVS